MNVKISDIDLLEALAIEEARETFWAYRQYINGDKLKMGWWQREIAETLQQFYEELIAGENPYYIIQAPPQHGKSSQIVDFISWVAGQNPDLKTIYTSFSKRLGTRANLRLQKIFSSEKYKKVFPDTKLSAKETDHHKHYTRNRELIEYVDHDGFFRNTTVKGPITGESLDFGIIDDPIKGRKQAESANERDTVWDWFTDDFFTRFSEDAGMLWIVTRWHHDDPSGRLIKSNPGDVKVFKYPAIAIEDEKNRKVNEALFPEHKSLDFLLKRKEKMPSASWEALYQQNPSVIGGDIIKSEWWKFYNSDERPKFFQKVIQSWDLTFDRNKKDPHKNDYVVGTVWGVATINRRMRAYLLDMVRQKANFNEQIRLFAELTKRNSGAFKKYVEKAANGAALVTFLENKISGIEAVPVVGGDKVARMIAVSPWVEMGQVFLPNPKEEPWVQTYLNEFTEFPSGDNDDQVDSTSQALFQIFGEYKSHDMDRLIRILS